MSSLLALAFMLETTAGLPEKLDYLPAGTSKVEITLVGNEITLNAIGRSSKSLGACPGEADSCEAQLKPLLTADHIVKFDPAAGCSQHNASARAEQKHVKKGPKLGLDIAPSNNNGREYSSVQKDTFFEVSLGINCKNPGKLGIAEFTLFNTVPGLTSAQVHFGSSARTMNETLSPARNKILLTQ